VTDFNQAPEFGNLSTSTPGVGGLGLQTYTRGSCKSGTAKTAARTGFFLGTVETDAKGNARFQTTLRVVPGVYKLQFGVGYAAQTCAAALYITGNGYAATVTVTVP